jgi:hypothetical protein
MKKMGVRWERKVEIGFLENVGLTSHNLESFRDTTISYTPKVGQRLVSLTTVKTS